MHKSISCLTLLAFILTFLTCYNDLNLFKCKGVVVPKYSILVMIIMMLLSSSLFSSVTLIDNLIDGDFTTEISIDHSENKDYLGATRTQNKLVILYFKAVPIENLSLELALQSSSTIARFETHDNSLYYAEVLYDGRLMELDYNLSANYYLKTYATSIEAIDMQADAFGIKANLSLNVLDVYVAYSQVGDNSTDANSYLDIRQQLLPTNALLNSDNYEPNTSSYAIDLSFEALEDITIGSRYVFMENALYTISYTGIYSSFILNELSRGLSVDFAFDKAGFDKEDHKLKLTVERAF